MTPRAAIPGFGLLFFDPRVSRMGHNGGPPLDDPPIYLSGAVPFPPPPGDAQALSGHDPVDRAARTPPGVGAVAATPPLAAPPQRGTEIRFGEKFLRIFEKHRHKAFFGGRGSAKSHSVATYLVIAALQAPKRIVCARQFQNSLRDSSKELIEQKIHELGLAEHFRILEREIICLRTGSRFTFIGLDRNPTAMKSLEGVDICWVEEASSISLISFEMLIPTIRKPGAEIIWTWNPDRRDDPVDAYFRGTMLPPGALVVRVGYEDNPWFFHTEMPSEMWFMKMLNPKRYEHIWLGDYDDTYEGRVFTNITVGRVEVPENVPPRYGMDFGFGKDPSSILKLYVIESAKTIYVARERTGVVPLRDLPTLMDDVLESRSDWIIGDSSQPGTIEHLRAQGFNITGSVKGAGSVKTGINWLQSYRIVIDPDCPNLIEEARLYSWMVDRVTKMPLSVPIDAHNHSWDAARYATEPCRLEPEGPHGGATRLRIG